jgi:signal peptidase II
MPVIGGSEFSFFDPVFNIADAAISVGMIMLILFYSKYIGKRDNQTASETDNQKIDNE